MEAEAAGAMIPPYPCFAGDTKKEFAATVEQLENKTSVVRLKSNGILITHVGTNDFHRGENVGESAKRYANTI